MTQIGTREELIRQYFAQPFDIAFRANGLHARDGTLYKVGAGNGFHNPLVAAYSTQIGLVFLANAFGILDPQLVEIDRLLAERSSARVVLPDAISGREHAANVRFLLHRHSLPIGEDAARPTRELQLYKRAFDLTEAANG